MRWYRVIFNLSLENQEMIRGSTTWTLRMERLEEALSLYPAHSSSVARGTKSTTGTVPHDLVLDNSSIMRGSSEALFG